MNFARIDLSPFPAQELPLLWKWMQEYPDQNSDDSGAVMIDEFLERMTHRSQLGIQTVRVAIEGQPVGAVAYHRVSSTVAEMRGICFTREVHGSGIPHRAVHRIFRRLQFEGTTTIYAAHFEDNGRVSGFLKKFGAVEQKHTLEPALRHGMPVGWKVVRIDLRTMPGLPVHQNPDARVPGTVLVFE